MKILLFNGSPKGEASDTMHLTRAFLDGMSSVSENDVTYIDVASKNIGYCRGCLSCKKNGGKCKIDDDMTGILQKILDADMLMFSFPLYNYGIPSPLKALLDRTMPLSSLAMHKSGDRYEHTCNADFSHLRYVMISGCGFPNASHNFEALRLEFAMMFPNNLYMLTVPEAPVFNAPEAASVTVPYLEVVRQAGREYAKYGSIASQTAKKLAEPMIPEEIYAKICNGEA